jgi:hypothetical protein
MLSIKTTRDSKGTLLTATVVEYAPEHENRNDWKTMAAAEEVARALGAEYIATDAGPYVSPRYDVQALPKVGDPVSYSFNGDSYPCGHVARISAGPMFRRIVVEEKHDTYTRTEVFWRRGRTGSWVKDGMWYLIPGHVNKRNPEF